MCCSGGQPYRSTQIIKRGTQMFMDSSLLTLTELLKVAESLKPVL